MGSSHRLPKLLAALLAVGAATGVAPQRAEAQATGSVQGVVQEAGTLRPLANMQVFVPAAGRGTLTNSAGRFMLLNVPAGQVQVQVQGVGYSTTSKTVTVTAGQVAEANFALDASAIALDEVVVTGTGAPTQRRALGNTIASVDAKALEDKPIQNVTQVLQGREPGVQALSGGGGTGEGGQITIRGSASLTQSNQPLIYVDGVRVDNSGGSITRSSRLDDLNPDAIERIEILKGAAAATLYGTEASNGVIQIFTKRGQSSDPRWTYGFETGFSRYPAERWAEHSGFARRQSQADSLAAFWGLGSLAPYQVFEVPYIESLFETGNSLTHSLSVSGGSDNITYFLSGRMSDEDGPFGAKQLRVDGFDQVQDIQDSRQANINLTIKPTDKLNVRATGMYIERYLEQPGQGNSTSSPYSIAMMSGPWRANEKNLSGTSSFLTVKEGLLRIQSEDVRRFGGSVGANYSPLGGLVLDATFGIDVVSSQGTTFAPFGYNVDAFTGTDVTGRRNLVNRNRRDLSLDVKANWAEKFGQDLSSTFVVGSQLLMAETERTGANGWNFPAPGLEVASAGANQEVTEFQQATVSGGVFAQEQIGFRDYAFVTVGARLDRHSAFGESTGGAVYPKISVSLVPSDMPFWTPNSLLSSVQLRGAIGQSGLQPGAFDQFTTYTATNANSQYGPGVHPSNLGNQNLKPEVSTEWEVGTSLGLFDNRYGLDVTYWNRTVNDLLIERQFVPSGGFRNTQIDNIGQMKAQGVELGLKGTLLQTENFTISPFVNGSYLWEQVTSLGGAPPIKTGTTVRYLNWHKEGYAPGAFYGPELANVPIPISLAGNCTASTREELVAYYAVPRDPTSLNGQILLDGCGSGTERDHYLGKPSPDWSGAFGADMSFLQNFKLSTQFEYKTGNYSVHNLGDAFRRSHVSLGRNIRESSEVEAILVNPASTADQRADAAIRWAKEIMALSPYDGLNEVEDGDFLRWREVSLTYSVPATLIDRLHLRTLDVTAGARNLMLWTKYSGVDPEQNVVAIPEGNNGFASQFTAGTNSWGLALPRRFTLSARLGF